MNCVVKLSSTVGFIKVTTEAFSKCVENDNEMNKIIIIPVIDLVI